MALLHGTRKGRNPMRHKDILGVACFGVALFAIGAGVTYAVGVIVVDKTLKTFSKKFVKDLTPLK